MLSKDESAPDAPGADKARPGAEQPEALGRRPARHVRVTLDVSAAAIWRVLLAMAGVLLLIKLRMTLTVLVFAFMLVAIFQPWMARIQARWGRRWAVAAVVGGYLATLAIVGYFVLPVLTTQVVNLVEHAPEYARQVQTTLAEHRIHWDMVHQVEAFSQKQTGNLANLMGLAENVMGIVYALLTVIVLSLYLLLDCTLIGNSLLRLLPRDRRLEVRRLGQKVGEQVGGYMRGQLIMSTMMGTTTLCLLLLLQVPAAFALAMLAAVADAIPIMGVWIALVPAVLLALANSPLDAVVVFAGYLLYHIVEINFIAPRVYKGTMGLSFSIVILSFVAGIELMGVLGAVLALPIAAVIPIVVNFMHEWNDPPDSPAGPLPG